MGIISYGAYIPIYRLRISEIAKVWGKDIESINNSLKIESKAVAGYDEDAVTMAFEAASLAIKKVSLKNRTIESVFLGSESYPYAVNPASTIVAEFLRLKNNYFSADLEFACKGATTALIVTSALIESGKINLGLIVGTDRAQAKPGDVLEYTASSAAAAFLLGNKPKEIIAQIIDYCSYSSDTPDFWRRDGMAFPSHGGRFSGEPGYFAHIFAAAQNLLAKTKTKPSDFSYCVFHMPNGKFPREIAERLRFTRKQLNPSLIVSEIGNPYSASSLLGLISVLEIAKPNEKIFFVSYGSGAGADAIYFKTTAQLLKLRKKGPALKKMMAEKKEIDYSYYLKMKKII